MEVTVATMDPLEALPGFVNHQHFAVAVDVAIAHLQYAVPIMKVVARTIYRIAVRRRAATATHIVAPMDAVPMVVTIAVMATIAIQGPIVVVLEVALGAAIVKSTVAGVDVAQMLHQNALTACVGRLVGSHAVI
jgi:hypothetical protein